MKLSPSFTELANLVNQMGAELVSWEIEGEPLSPQIISEILLEGIEISIKEVELTPSGLLTYKGEQILLYIKDTNKSKHTLLHDACDGPRFHVTECRTLDSMRKGKRFDRYIVTRDTSGQFDVEYRNQVIDEHGEVVAEEHGKVVAGLMVCKNCLKKLNYKDFEISNRKHRDEVWDNFSIEEFFEIYKSHFKEKPKYTDKTAPKGGYSDEWTELSKKVRDSTGWKCEECNVDLSEPPRRKLLHVHHLNGVKGDNGYSNLKALCILCHSEQYQHTHMLVTTADKTTITDLRYEQGT